MILFSCNAHEHIGLPLLEKACKLMPGFVSITDEYKFIIILANIDIAKLPKPVTVFFSFV